MWRRGAVARLESRQRFFISWSAALSINPYEPPQTHAESPANDVADPAAEAFEPLPRILSRLDAVAIVVGSIIGSGIFLKPVRVASDLNSFGLEIVVWVVVGLVTLCGALSLAELAAMLPQAGGPYVYLRAAYGRLAAFLWGWTEFWIIRTGSVGALACASAIYLAKIVPLGHLEQAICAVAIIAVLTLTNAAGVKWGARVQNATTIIKVSFLLALILVPLLIGRAEVEHLAPLWPQTSGASAWRALGLAMIAVFWPYDGWINIAPVAEEIKEPQRNVPFALVTGMVIVTLLYVGAVVSYHLVLPMAQVQASSAVAADVSEALFGDWGRVIAALAVMCSTFGACNSNLLCGPRIYFAVARDGLLPAALHKIDSNFRTPANAIVLQGAWGIVLTIAAFWWKSGPNQDPRAAFDALTDFVIFGGSLFYALAVGAVFVLRAKSPHLERPYRTWGYPITPAIYLAAFAAALVSLFMEKQQQSLAGCGLIALGAAYFVIVTQSQRRNAAEKR
jgi:APA family basic amino acid/polyamine antiporter